MLLKNKMLVLSGRAAEGKKEHPGAGLGRADTLHTQTLNYPSLHIHNSVLLVVYYINLGSTVVVFMSRRHLVIPPRINSFILTSCYLQVPH